MITDNGTALSFSEIDHEVLPTSTQGRRTHGLKCIGRAELPEEDNEFVIKVDECDFFERNFTEFDLQTVQMSLD